MTAKSLRGIVAINTASNYILIAVRMVYVILVTRWLYHYLGTDYYGFWSILWAFFTYVVIFNLGFGASLQKYTAENLFEKDISKYNKIVSMIFGSYVGVSSIMAGITLVGAYYIEYWTGLHDMAKIEMCRQALYVFVGGMAVLFPLSIFTDILTGLKLIWLRNCVNLFTRLSEAAGIMLVIWLDKGFTSIIIVTMGINIFFALSLWFIVRNRIKGFRLVAYFNFEIFKEIYNFSFFVYLNSVANLVIAKTDRFVLSSILGLPAVSSYQIATRMPEISQTLSTQFQDNVIPVSASLIKSGDKAGLRNILLSGLRFGAFVSVGATALFSIMTTPTIRFLFGVQNSDITQICHIFLASQLVYCVIRAVPARYLQIAGFHKEVASASIIEAICNLGLSIWLCSKIGVLGVAWGTLIPNILISCLVVFPLAYRRLKFRVNDIVKIFVKPVIAVLLPIFVCVGAHYYFKENLHEFLPLFITYASSGSIYCIMGWFFVLTDEERKFIIQKIKPSK